MAKKITYDVTGRVDGYETSTVSLQSEWKCVKSCSKYVWETSPTTAKSNITFTYWMPSGAKIKSAKLMFKKNNPLSGISVLTINKKSVKKSTELKLSIRATSGTLTLPIEFKANGTKKDASSHAASLVLSNVKLRVIYEEPAAMSATTSELYNKYGDAFPVPKQGVCLYRQDTETIYSFDGVVKVEHSLSSKFEEEPDSHKSEYTNGARNEPDKVKIEVAMSDVYTTINNLTKASSRTDDQKTAMDAAAKALGFGEEMDGRSSAAFAALYTLKTDRCKITVITPQYIYVDMILGSFTATWDESTPFGWTGQLEFQHYYNTSSSSNTTSSTKTTELDTGKEISTMGTQYGTGLV